jgi:hypothetical protein
VRTAVAKVVEGDFARRIAANPKVRPDVAGVVCLDITGDGGGQWTVDSLTVRCAAEDFVALVQGEKNVQLAVMSGELKLEPMDLDLAAKLAPLFR